MNERLKELMKQAMDYHSNGYVDCPELNPEKFAELIEKKAIKDCRDMFMVGSVSWNLLNEKLELYGVE